MSKSKISPSMVSHDDIPGLIETLLETERRLVSLTSGEVDSVSGLDGRTFLLQRAQEHLRHREASKQAAILNALPAPIALIDAQGIIISVNDAWRIFPTASAIQRPGYEVGVDYLHVCELASSEMGSNELANGIRSVLNGELEYFAMEYSSHSPNNDSWCLLSIVPLDGKHRVGAVITHLDITEQKQNDSERKIMEEALFAEKERAQVTLNCIGDAVICADAAGFITFINPVAEEMTGWSAQEASKRPVEDVLRMVNANSRQPVLGPSNFAYVESSGLTTSYMLKRRDGCEIPVDETAAPIHDGRGSFAGTVIVIRDMSAAHSMALEKTHLAEHDYLTGLPNRMLLADRIGQAIAIARRHSKKVGVLFLDVDGFKYINDSLGHPIGDKLLQSIAERLSSCIRESDTVSRPGGDEFVVLLSEMEKSEDAAISAQRMLKAVARAHSVDEHELHVTTSIGVSVYPDDGADSETLIKNADMAMYQAKENGRQSYQFYKPAMNVRAVERQTIEEGLRRALERKEFSLHYQQKVNLRTGVITGAEALIRWTHATIGPIFPAQFIPVAEASGLILPIGSWVLREACAQARAWVDAGLPLTTMAVNVSAVEFRNENFLESVFSVLSDTGLDPKWLELELTESVLMKRAESTASILQCLREKGVRVAIDDFGTGYSSLSYLRKFPVDSLKIDQSFVREIGAGGDDMTIVKAVIGMAKNLKMKVVAEGVETLEELEFLRAHQCDEAQGYYFGRPVGPAQFAKLLCASTRSVEAISETDQPRLVAGCALLSTLAP